MLIPTYLSQAGITGFVARLFDADVSIHVGVRGPRRILTTTAGGSDDGLCRWFSVGDPGAQGGGLPSRLGQGRQGVERIRRARIPRMRRRRLGDEGKRDVPEAREGEE